MKIIVDRNTIVGSDLRISDDVDLLIEISPPSDDMALSRALHSIADAIINNLGLGRNDVTTGNRIQAIKAIRTITGADLRTAKEFVDRFNF